MTTDERLEHLEELVREGFAEMRQRFDAADNRLDAADRRMDRQDAYLADFRSDVIHRFEKLENRMEMLILTVQSLDTRVPAFTKAVLDLQGRIPKRELPAA